MTPHILPHAKEPAMLVSMNSKGIITPIVNDSFEGCAWLLKRMWPPAKDSELWIECMGQKIDGALVDAHFRASRVAGAD